jgi:hypothetical protein
MRRKCQSLLYIRFAIRRTGWHLDFTVMAIGRIIDYDGYVRASAGVRFFAFS